MQMVKRPSVSCVRENRKHGLRGGPVSFLSEMRYRRQDLPMNAVQERFKVALELRALMISMYRSRLEREHPEAEPAWIEHRLNEWVVGCELPTDEEQEPPS